MTRLPRLRGALPQGGFVRGAITIAGATGTAQAITIVTSPILTRLYSPSDYGAFAVAGVVLTILIAVACLRYELAIPLPPSDVGAANVIALTLLVTAALSLAMVPIVWLAGPWFLQLIGAPSLGRVALLLPIGMLAGGALAALTGWMLRTKAYGEIAANRVLQSATVVAVQIGLGVAGGGAAGLLVGTVVGGFAGLGRLARVSWRSSRNAFRAVQRPDVAATATRYRRFPIYSAPSVVINLLGLDAPLIWMVAAYGANTGGQFALAMRIVTLPIGVLAAAVGQVYFAEAAGLARERPDSLGPLFRKTTRSLIVLGLGPFTVGALISPFLFPIIFGQAWGTAGLYVAILAPMSFLQFVAWPTGGTLDVLERQDLHLLREVGRLVLIGGAILLATVIGLDGSGAVVSISLAGGLTNIAYGLISWWSIASRRSHPLAPAGAHADGATGDLASDHLGPFAGTSIGADGEGTGPGRAGDA